MISDSSRPRSGSNPSDSLSSAPQLPLSRSNSPSPSGSPPASAQPSHQDTFERPDQPVEVVPHNHFCNNAYSTDVVANRKFPDIEPGPKAQITIHFVDGSGNQVNKTIAVSLKSGAETNLPSDAQIQAAVAIVVAAGRAGPPPPDWQSIRIPSSGKQAPFLIDRSNKSIPLSSLPCSSEPLFRWAESAQPSVQLSLQDEIAAILRNVAGFNFEIAVLKNELMIEDLGPSAQSVRQSDSSSVVDSRKRSSALNASTSRKSSPLQAPKAEESKPGLLSSIGKRLGLGRPKSRAATDPAKPAAKPQAKSAAQTSAVVPYVGIANARNDCFAISALQLIFASKHLNALLDGGFQNKDGETPDVTAARQEIFDQLVEIRAAVRSPSTQAAVTAATMRSFLDKLAALQKAQASQAQPFNNERQHAAGEVLRFICEALDPNSTAAGLVVASAFTDIPEKNDFGVKIVPKAPEIQNHPVAFKLDLKPAIGSMQEALNAAIAEEKLTGVRLSADDGTAAAFDYKYTGELTHAHRITSAPDSLTFELNRVEGRRDGRVQKNEQEIDARRDLELDVYNSGNDVAEVVSYALKACVVHAGTADNGHYVTYQKLENGQWLCQNDAHSEIVSEADALTAIGKGGVLFTYEKQVPLVVEENFSPFHHKS